jgi:creatinine amidohydrolase
MRTRFLSKCTNDEVEAYLQRRDVIVVAAGVTELHGGLPLDAESVLSEALALRLAERADGLVLHNLPYLYAGATASGRGTTQLTVRQSIDFCYALAESLIRQGFRRIIWTSFHGPAGVFVSPVIRDIFEAHKVAMLYIDPLEVMAKKSGGMIDAFSEMGGVDPFGDLTVAAYDILGRLGDIPLTTPETTGWAEQKPASMAFAKDLIGQAFGSSSVAYYFAELTDHMPTQCLWTPEEVTAAAERGRPGLDSIVDAIPIEKLVDDLCLLDAYNAQVLQRRPSTRSV